MWETGMTIHDREYYRREGPGFLERFGSNGRVCLWLIAINVAVFFIQINTRVVLPKGGVDQGPVVHALTLDVKEVLHGEVWRLLTYAFLHDTTHIMHIVFNMLFLWWFGKEMEEL